MPTRRRFLAGAVLGGAFVATGGAGAAPPARADAPQRERAGRAGKPLGVALLGLGGYAGGQLAPALQRTRHCRLAGIVTGTPNKVPIWQRRYGIADGNVYDYGSLPRIADNDAIDVVYIVVPTGLHAKYAIMAAEAGKHVWCEKPMAMDPDECDRIIQACSRNRVKLSIGYRMQHEPNTRTVIRYAATRPYGAIRKLTALAGYRGRGKPEGWRFERDMGGGALYDMGVYPINALRYASGMEPIRVRRAQQRMLGEVDVTTEFELEFPGGVVGYGRTSVREDINQLRVECEKGWIELKPMQTYDGVQGRTSDGRKLEKPIENQQAQQMDDDAQAILHDRPVRVPGEEGRRDIRLVQAIRAAATRGTAVDL